MERLRRLWEICEHGAVDVSLTLWIGPGFPFFGFHVHIHLVDDAGEDNRA